VVRKRIQRIAEKKGTDPEAKFKKLSRHVQQKATGLKIRRVNKKLKKGFVHKLVLTDPATGAVTAVEDTEGMEAMSKATSDGLQAKSVNSCMIGSAAGHWGMLHRP
jgi:hypothetical protein